MVRHQGRGRAEGQEEREEGEGLAGQVKDQVLEEAGAQAAELGREQVKYGW